MNQPASLPALSSIHIPAQLDFAHVVGNCLVAYGWIAGLSSQVATAGLQAGQWSCDLLNDALLIARPDVSAHLAGSHAGSGDDGHGFFVLSELGETVLTDSLLRVTLSTRNGDYFQQQWTIVLGAEAAAQTLRMHERAMRLLLSRLSPRQMALLASFFQPPLQLRAGDLHSGITTFGPPLHVPVACTLDQGILVLAGTLPVALGDFESLDLRSTGQVAPLLSNLTELPNASGWPVQLHPGTVAPSHARAFVAVMPWVDRGLQGRPEIDVLHRAQGSSGAQRLTVRRHPQDAQGRLWSWLNELDAENRIAACEALLKALPPGDTSRKWREALIMLVESTIEALPGLIEGKEELSSVFLFPERALLVPGAGIIIEGWSNADPGFAFSLHYCSNGTELPVSERWIRRSRPDVRTHLAERGFGNVDEPGYSCLVPVSYPPRPAYLRAQAGKKVWRIKLSLPGTVEPTRRLVRSILSTIDPACSELRRQLDQHVGPAVAATWAARARPRGAAQVQHFGPQVRKPTVSLIVPLFGRQEFADYQLALFTDDPELHQAEIIYVVDDPTIIHDFRLRCPDLYAMHGLAFTLAYPGDNLGFAGATNFGASQARAPLLLLLNSDVFPQSPGWLGRLCAQYREAPDTGLLGVKLLYEDGTVQHAGMDSVPLAQWQGLWINRHPHKGLDPTALTGLIEVPAVTAACVLIETGFYRSLGGLSEDYIIGDFEDSDLCYRARQTGRKCRVDLDIVLYHLERQSQDLGDQGWRTALTLYNCWLHDARWGHMLKEGAL